MWVSWPSSAQKHVMLSKKSKNCGAHNKSVGREQHANEVLMLDDVAFIKAGEQMGLPRVEDINRPEQEGVGYATSTRWKGRRQSTAQTFLKQAKGRPNLKVMTDVLVD